MGAPFSIGVYPDLVRAREALEGRIGKWPAMLVGLVSVLKEARPVKLRVDGRAHTSAVTRMFSPADSRSGRRAVASGLPA